MTTNFGTKLTTTRPPWKIIVPCLHVPPLYAAARLYSVAMGPIPRSTGRISSLNINQRFFLTVCLCVCLFLFGLYLVQFVFCLSVLLWLILCEFPLRVWLLLSVWLYTCVIVSVSDVESHSGTLGRHFRWDDWGEYFWISLLKWSIWCTLYSWEVVGPHKRCGVQGKISPIPPSPLDRFGLCLSVHLVFCQFVCLRVLRWFSVEFPAQARLSAANQNSGKDLWRRRCRNGLPGQHELHTQVIHCPLPWQHRYDQSVAMATLTYRTLLHAWVRSICSQLQIKFLRLIHNVRYLKSLNLN